MAKMSAQKTISSLTSFPSALLKFISEAREELRRVTWPSRQVTTRYTIIVIIASIAVGLVIGGVDFLFSIFIERVI